MNASTENLIGRMLEPVFRTLPVETAERIALLPADEDVQSRVEFLAARANEGELTDDEREEYQAIIDAVDILATLQSLARDVVRRASE